MSSQVSVPIPVNADAPVMDVVFFDHPDPHIGEFGARGVGELGTTGIAAAVANAVHHATGRRIRDLPITTEKLIH
jgi:xanthine dehydrogenase YagR molybdenum-binding subunit